MEDLLGWSAALDALRLPKSLGAAIPDDWLKFSIDCVIHPQKIEPPVLYCVTGSGWNQALAPAYIAETLVSPLRAPLGESTTIPCVYASQIVVLIG